MIERDGRIKCNLIDFFKSVESPVILITSKLFVSKIKQEYRPLFKEIIIIDFSIENLISIFKNSIKKYSINIQNSLLGTLDEMLIEEAGMLRDFFKVQGPGYSESIKFKNKLKMKEIIVMSKIRCPKYIPFDFKPR